MICLYVNNLVNFTAQSARIPFSQVVYSPKYFRLTSWYQLRNGFQIQLTRFMTAVWMERQLGHIALQLTLENVKRHILLISQKTVHQQLVVYNVHARIQNQSQGSTDQKPDQDKKNENLGSDRTKINKILYQRSGNPCPQEDEDESILDTRAEPIKVTNFYSTGSTSGGSAGGVGVGSGGGGALSTGGLQSSMAINAGYPMLKCYSCHAQWTLDSNNDCVKTKFTTNTIDCPSLSCESITISFQTTTDTNVLYYAWRGCTLNPEDGIIPNSIILNPTDYLEKKSSQFGKFQDLNIYVERSIQSGIQKINCDTSEHCIGSP